MMRWHDHVPSGRDLRRALPLLNRLLLLSVSERDVLHQNASFREATTPCGIAYNYARIRRLVRPRGRR
jgi:hypothetical protein